MFDREHAAILILSALVIASGFIVLRQNNQINQLNEQYSILQNQSDSIILEHLENQQNLEEKILYETLKMALIEEKIPTFNILTYDTQEIVISSENIEDIYVPAQMGEYSLHKLTLEEIEAKKKSEGDFLYLVFTKFEPDQEFSVVHIRTAGIFDSGGGMNIGFQQMGTIYGGWIS